MILSRLIVKWLEWIIEIGIWITLIAAFLAGTERGNGFFDSLVTGILFTLGAGIFCAITFGFFIVLNDIRTMLRTEIAARRE